MFKAARGAALHDGEWASDLNASPSHVPPILNSFERTAQPFYSMSVQLHAGSGGTAQPVRNGVEHHGIAVQRGDMQSIERYMKRAKSPSISMLPPISPPMRLPTAL